MNQPDQHEVAVGGTANNDRPTQDQLNADCWEKVFDCLSFQEIYNMSQTCKRLQRIVGFYGKQYLPAVRSEIEVYGPQQRFAAEIENQDGLNEYINELSISCDLYPEFKLNRRLCAESFPSVKKLTLLRGEMKESQFHHVEGILSQIEALEIECCHINGDLFVRLLKHCSKLKSLRVRWGDIGTHWLHHEYPTLENFEFKSGSMVPTGAEMVAFLTNNPNIKRFQIKAEFIWANMQAFKEAEIRLDCLVIDDFSNVPIGSFVRLLDELHGRRFYKSLHIHSWSIEDLHEFVDIVAPLSTLNALNIDYMCLVIDISHLVHLKELHCGYFGDTMHLENLAKNLVNLEQLSISYPNPKDVIPFVRHSKKLSKLCIAWVRGDILDLMKLNSERQKLKDEMRGRSPKIVAVYVGEKSYLATKWHMTNVSLDLIELKRTEMVLRIDNVPYNQE